MAQFHTLKVKSIVRQTEKAVSVTFDIPTNLEPEFAFKAGQYITLKAIITALDAEARLIFKFKSKKWRFNSHYQRN